MPSHNLKQDSRREKLLAELTSEAYRVVLKHGLNAPFIDVELELWEVLRNVIHRECSDLHNLCSGTPVSQVEAGLWAS